jgi:hypothetical protein
MKKIKLNLESLEVESFAAAEDTREGGTVRGNGGSNRACNSAMSCLADTCYFYSCFESDCGGCVTHTCDLNCTASCTNSCNEPCLNSCSCGC